MPLFACPSVSTNRNSRIELDLFIVFAPYRQHEQTTRLLILEQNSKYFNMIVLDFRLFSCS